MSAIISVENEAFKLKMKAGDKTTHNFRPRSRSIELTVCRNSFAAFQIVLQCDFRSCSCRRLSGCGVRSQGDGRQNRPHLRTKRSLLRGV